MEDGRQEHKTVGAAGEFFRELDDARQHAWRLDDGGVGTAAESVLAFEFDGEIEALVEHPREGVRGIEPDRRQYWHHLAVEVISNPLALRLVPARAAQEADALLGQCRQDHVIEVLVLLGNDGMRFGSDQTEGFLRRLAVVGNDWGLRADLFLEAGNADLEEFVEVAGNDAQEAQAFEQRHALVLRLCQHAAIEGKQAELAVEVVCRREAGFQERMGHRARSNVIS